MCGLTETGTQKVSQISWVWTESGSEEALVPRKEVLSAQLARVRIPTRSSARLQIGEHALLSQTWVY
jgi:hypothetical protein